MVIPTPLVQEYRAATEGCKKLTNICSLYLSYPEAEGSSYCLPRILHRMYKHTIIDDGHWLWSSSWKTRLESWTRWSAAVDSGAVPSIASWVESKLRAKTQPEPPGWEGHRRQNRHRSHQDRGDRAQCAARKELLMSFASVEPK